MPLKYDPLHVTPSGCRFLLALHQIAHTVYMYEQNAISNKIVARDLGEGMNELERACKHWQASCMKEAREL